MMLLNGGVGEDSWEFLGLQGDETSQSKGTQPLVFIEGLMLKLKLLWPPDVTSWRIGKDPDAGKDWGQEEMEVTEDEMVQWHHRLNGHEFEQAPGYSEG